ncbi:MAG TPA: oxidoreductase [Verrucomicrobiales bacterium]|nr:oxidoreductase [Verrucomicrobiales bacterium]
MQNNSSPQPSGNQSRRSFIKKSATAAAVVAASHPFITPVYGQNQAPSTGRVIGANDRISVGFVGVGGQGMAHVTSMCNKAGDTNVDFKAVCDVWTKRIDGAKSYIEGKIAGAKVEGYDDYRKIMDRKDIDAICCSTVDHWHTRVTVDAMNAGKHVYVEKPMTRYLGEAFEIYDTAKRTGKKVQVGSQGSSDQKYHKAAEIIRAGDLGQLVLLQGSYMRNSPKGEWNYTIDPDLKSDNCNWDRWLGPVHKKVKFDPDHYFRWRKYYPYCGGLLGDLMPHRLHPLMIATGKPEFPSRVVCLGTKAFNTDRNTPGTYQRDVDENTQLVAEFPSGMNMIITSSTVNEQGWVDTICGHKATIYLGGNRVELKPERPFSDEIDPLTLDNVGIGEPIDQHEKNFFDCIRNGNEPNAGAELAVRVQTVISLAEMSDRLNIMCLFDEKTRKITTGDGKEVAAITYGTLPLS